MKIDPNDPAFPYLIESCQRINETEMWPGLSIRAEFAKTAMQGLLTQWTSQNEIRSEIDIVKQAIRMADALINELNKE